MNEFDWQSMAHAIREQRFRDIPLDAWNLIADKIENMKRGKGRPPGKKDFFDSLGTNSKSVENAIDLAKRDSWITKRFAELINQGEKATAAKKLIVDELPMVEIKTVEAALTRQRKFDRERKIQHEALSKQDWSSEGYLEYFYENIERYTKDGKLIANPEELYLIIFIDRLHEITCINS